MQKWYLEIDESQSGPFTFEEVRQHASAGTISLQSLVWTSGMEDWAPLGTTTLRQLVAFDDVPKMPAFSTAQATNSPLPPKHGGFNAAHASPQNPADLYVFNGHLPTIAPERKNSRGMVGVILSSIGVSLLGLPVVGALLCFVGMILGCSGRRRMKKLQHQATNTSEAYHIRDSRGLSTAAIWVGFVGFILNLAFTAFFGLMVKQDFEAHERAQEHRHLQHEIGHDHDHAGENYHHGCDH